MSADFIGRSASFGTGLTPPSERVALAHLSRAAVAFGRHAAGLPHRPAD